MTATLFAVRLTVPVSTQCYKQYHSILSVTNSTTMYAVLQTVPFCMTATNNTTLFTVGQQYHHLCHTTNIITLYFQYSEQYHPVFSATNSAMLYAAL